MSYEKNENKQKRGRVWPIFKKTFPDGSFKQQELD